MTDAQFGILIAAITGGLGSLAAVIRWSVSQLTKALDNNTQAHLSSVKAMTEMSTKLDFVYDATGKVDNFIRRETSDVYDTREMREITPRRGQYHHLRRPKTEPGEDK